MRRQTRNPSLVTKVTRQDGRCWYCQQPMTLELGQPNTATKEHLDPAALPAPPGGRRVVAACFRCNQTIGPRPMIRKHGWQPPPVRHGWSEEARATLADVWPR